MGGILKRRFTVICAIAPFVCIAIVVCLSFMPISKPRNVLTTQLPQANSSIEIWEEFDPGSLIFSLSCEYTTWIAYQHNGKREEHYMEYVTLRMLQVYISADNNIVRIDESGDPLCLFYLDSNKFERVYLRYVPSPNSSVIYGNQWRLLSYKKVR